MVTTLIVISIVLCVVGLCLAARPKKFTTLFIMLFGLTAFGQSNCDRVVADTAGMLGGKITQVEQAAAPLINQGADVHVVTVPDSKGNLDFIENDIEKSCQSWRNPQGVRKSTLLALLVSKDRKLGIYYGSAWSSALGSHWNRIKTDYVVPRFRDGDYAGGFIAAEEQLTKRLVAAKDESLKPAVTQNTVVNQATDNSGLWRFFTWALVLGLIAFTWWMIVSIIRSRKKYNQDRDAAQQRAKVASNNAAQDISKFEQYVEQEEALGNTVSPYAKRQLDTASQSYSNLANSVSTSPDTTDLEISSYEVMEEQYEAVSRLISQARAVVNGVSVKENQKEEPSKPSNHSKQSHHSHSSKPSAASETSSAYVPPAPVPTQVTPVPYIQPVPVYTPVYNEPNVIVINNEPHHRHEDDYVAPAPRVEEPSSSSWGSSSSSEDSGGGGSSSWSSSDSSSSSSFDSGGSSSFDSGSSDSGGGGSSDF